MEMCSYILERERRTVTKLNQIDKRTGVGLQSWVTCKSQWVLGTISREQWEPNNRHDRSVVAVVTISRVSRRVNGNSTWTWDLKRSKCRMSWSENQPLLRTQMSRSILVKKKKNYGVQGINFLNSNFTTDTISLSTESKCKSDIIWGVECG